MTRSGQKASTPLYPDRNGRAGPSPGPGAKKALVLRARVVAPITRPSFENGAVLVRGNEICAVGKWRQISTAAPAGSPVVDLGDVAILPGLVNAHAHLDYSDMAGQLPPPHSFTDWIKLITEAKSGWQIGDFAASWINGARMLLESGTTTVADVEAAPVILPDVWAATPLRVFSFLEITGVRSRLAPRTVLAEVTCRAKKLCRPKRRVGLAPHAPYSTTPAILKLAGRIARVNKWRLTTHVAESLEEDEMFRHARGPMFDWLKRNFRDMSDCGRRSPVAHLAQQGILGPDLLAVHANCLDQHDIALLARHATHVVHCPRSHHYFDHPPFQYRHLTRAGIRICLGTDSLATVLKKRAEHVTLDLFAEMRAFAAAFPGVQPATVLMHCTESGAAALGLEKRIGRLAPGMLADLIAVPCHGRLQRAEEEIIAHSGRVCASMIEGQFVLGGPSDE